VVAKAAGDMISAKDGNTHLVDGLELLGPSDTDAFQEGVHPNDLGFVRIADRIEPILRRILRLSDAAEAESREADAPN
jgi:lysophospholipase L1-like esterase